MFESTPVSNWKVVEHHENWEIKERDIIRKSTEQMQVCKICGEEMLSFIIGHLKTAHGKSEQ